MFAQPYRASVVRLCRAPSLAESASPREGCDGKVNCGEPEEGLFTVIDARVAQSHGNDHRRYALNLSSCVTSGALPI